MTELAYRFNDGLSVSLLWSRLRNSLTVTVADERTGEAFELDAPSDKALDVFYHPYAYVKAHGVATSHLLAAGSPVL